jgi:acyl-CoA synthetase (AMP-forming)/AMP-acid ligase II
VRAAGKALAYSSRISAINADVERMDVVAETLCPALKKPIAHPDVYDVVVVGRPSERWGSEIVAIVQLTAGASTKERDLAEVCDKRIARYKVPKAFVFVEKVVRSPAGKADYRCAKDLAVGVSSDRRGHALR